MRAPVQQAWATTDLIRLGMDSGILDILLSCLVLKTALSRANILIRILYK
jgi:hypothetical protein